MNRLFSRTPPYALLIVSLGLYAITLAPTVVTLFDDSLELQLALPTLAIIHPTGYPLYSILGWLAVKLIPLGDAAYRANLFSALAAAGAVVMLYAVARRLGSLALPALAAALLFAIGPVWWSQATIAEVYALQGFLTLIILFALLRWDECIAASKIGLNGHRASMQGRFSANAWLTFVGFSFGLGLAHHRLTLLLMPPALLFIFWTAPNLIRRPRVWLAPILAFFIPLLLYFTIPLRSHIGSLDGTYAQIGFWGWILGGGYSVFLRDNPFGVERDLFDLLRIALDQYGWLGFLAALPGYSIWREKPRQFTLLFLIGLIDLLFASRYLVADIEVFLIPLFIVWALFLAVGLTAFLRFLAPLFSRAAFTPLSRLFALFLILWPLLLIPSRLPQQDRSQPPARAWGVYDYGLDMMEHMEVGGSVVGLLGEMTLIRYFQRTEGLRLDIETVAADPEPERLAAIRDRVEKARPTYTTRPLTGLAEAYSLEAAGPLVRVWPAAATRQHRLVNAVSAPLTPQISLIGWQTTLRHLRSGPALRVELLWRVHAVPEADFKISARVLAADGQPLAQKDDFPVHNAYPPTRWRAGETILDAYDLLLPATTAPLSRLQIIAYDPQTGQEIARWEQDLNE
ncbi:MAG: DUF2723 domain-containing protein [Chloroflexi bacterium]|nr:DUF2723 domain-containing protein [Chloroflexota bacterium]